MCYVLQLKAGALVYILQISIHETKDNPVNGVGHTFEFT